MPQSPSLHLRAPSLKSKVLPKGIIISSVINILSIISCSSSTGRGSCTMGMMSDYCSGKGIASLRNPL